MSIFHEAMSLCSLRIAVSVFHNRVSKNVSVYFLLGILFRLTGYLYGSSFTTYRPRGLQTAARST